MIQAFNELASCFEQTKKGREDLRNEAADQSKTVPPEGQSDMNLVT